ncbi:MAG: hypothetical protein U0Y10_20010 [Spirosomataceae bacterium]
MRNAFDFKKLIPHLIAVVGFIVIAGIYASPVWQGKRLAQHDSIQAKAAAHEVKQFHDETGEWSAWTNSMFGGMPAYLIATDYPTSFPTKVGQLIGSLLPEPVNLLVLLMLGAYILMATMGVNHWLSALGAIAYAFSSYNILFIEAGHISKMIALAYAPGILAGVMLVFRGRHLLGAAITALFLSLNLYGNHVQVTYYVFLAIGIYAVIESIQMIREGKVKQLVTAVGLLLVAGLVAVGTHTTRLWTTLEYSKESNRGKSELTPAKTNNTTSADADKEYAFSYSYGVAETLTLLIPNAYGGSSQGGLNTKSELYKNMTSQGLDGAAVKQFVEKMAPLYWGGLPVAGGPAYAGAIVCFLFVLGCFVIKGRTKWWLLGSTVFFTFIAWGKHFELFNYAMFDFFPYFNKFRAATMIFSVVQLLMVISGVLGLKQIIDASLSFQDLKKPLLYSLGLTAGVAFVFAVVPGIFFDFRATTDIQYLGQIVGDEAFGRQLVNSLVEDRQQLLRTDAFRSMVLILLAAGLIWALVSKKISAKFFYPILTFLLLFDLFAVDKRYLNNEDFLTKSAVEERIAPTAADQQILQDKALSYRVFDLTGDPFSNALPSYFHKSVGGYHGAKMRRYLELIENQIAKNNLSVLNMLNVKYLIQASKSGEPIAVPNPEASGNAWFVKNYNIVANADEEIKALDKFQPTETAFVDKRFESSLNNLKIAYDSTNTIRLTSYKPNALTYESSNQTPQLAVFSEIFYQGNRDWKSYIDGKETPHVRANYVLRAIVVPPGKHKVEFKFDPPAVSTGHTIDLVASILLVLFIGIAVFLDKKQQTA